MNDTLKSISVRLAETVLDIGAVKLSPKDPFTWASGYRMPVYNDNRLLLGKSEYRFLVSEGFQELIQFENLPVDVVAGTATAGIAPATTLANALEKPLVYVRPKPKNHGMQNQIEGPLNPGDNVLVIEDLISTGGSALKAVEALRAQGAKVSSCLSIFTYGFETASVEFEKYSCRLLSLLTFPFLIAFASQTDTISPQEKKILENWYQNPFDWGENHGFPKN